jgi:hypothetical protein
MAINLALKLSVSAPQRRIAVNLFSKLGVAVDFARRGDRGGELRHTYFYVKRKAKAPEILDKVPIQTESTAFVSKSRAWNETIWNVREPTDVTLELLRRYYLRHFARRRFGDSGLLRNCAYSQQA